MSDVAGNPAIEATRLLTVTDGTGGPSTPTVIYTTASPSTADLDAGQTVTLTLILSEAVTVDTSGGTPTLTLNDNSTATYDAASSSGNVLAFDYTVGAGENTADLAITAANANGASIIGSSDIDADLSRAASNPSGTLQIDTTAPTVSSVTMSPPGSDLDATQGVAVSLAMSEVVLVSGTPTLTLNSGGSASYVSGSGTGTLLFSYTVGAGENAAALAVTGADMSNGTISDLAGNSADLSDATANPTGSIEIDTTPPTIAIDAPVAGDNIINAAEAAAGITVTGTVSGAEDGQPILVNIVDSSRTPVDQYSSTVSGGSWSVLVPSSDAQALANGSYSITANVSDAAGNAAVQASQAIRVDETPPVIAITGSGGSAVNIAEAATGFTVSGTTVGVETGQTVTVAFIDASFQSVGSYTAVVSGNSWSFQITSSEARSLADGNDTLTATVSDAAGNPATPATRGLRVDETAPAIQITPIAGDNTINLAEASAGAAIAGTTTGVEDGQVASIRVFDSAGVLVDKYSATVSGEAWSAAITPAQARALTNGIYSVKVDLSDSAGNPAPEATQSLIVDETPPIIAIGGPIAGNDTINIAKAASPIVISGTTGGLEDGQVVTVTFVDANGTVQQTLQAIATGNAWSTTLSAAEAQALPDGSDTLIANVSDVAGNPAVAATEPITIDETAPTVSSVTASPATADLDAGQTITLTLGMSELVDVDTSSGTPILHLNNGSTATYLSGSGTATLSFQYVILTGQDTADLAVSSVGLNGGTIADPAGNAADLSGAVVNPAGVLQIDTTAPTVTAITASPATADLDAGNTVTLTLALSEAVTVSTGGSTPTLSLSSGGTASYVSGSGSNSLVFSYVVAPGQNTPDLTVTGLTLHGGSITDGAGNTLSAASVVQNPAGTLQVDTTAPTLAITAAAGDNRVNAVEAANGFVITGTSNAEAGQTVTVVVLNSNGTQVASYSPAVSGSAWSASVPSGTSSGLAEGTYTVQANVSDAAGNTATQAVGSFVVDVTPPSITISTVAGDNILNLAEATAGFTVSGAAPGAEDGQVVTITIVNGSGSTVATDTGTVSSGVWSASVTAAQARGLVDGGDTVNANVSDAAGNPATTASQSLTVDETPPTVAAITASPSTADLDAGNTVTLTLALSEAVTVSTGGGTPTLSLSSGGTASYVSGSGSNSLVFSYVVAPGQNTPDLTVTGLTLHGGSITDGAGNTLSAASVVQNPAGTLQVDTTAPTLAITAAAGDNRVNAVEATDGFAITGTSDAEDGQTVTVVVLDGTDTQVASYTATVSGGAWSASVPSGTSSGLAEGTYTVQANVSDAAGNPATGATDSFVVDLTPPTITIGTIAGDNTLSLAEATAGFTISGTAPGAEDGQVVTVTLVNGGGTTVDTVTGTVSSNAWSASLTSTQARGLADGSYMVKANVSDAAGNPATTASQSLTVDETPPTVAAITASPATADLDAGNTVTLTLALSEAVTVSTGGGTPTLSLSSAGTASYVSGSGSNSLVFSYVVAAGQNTSDLTVAGLTLHGGSITDAAGNPVTASSVVRNPAGTLQIDTIAPTLAITATAGDNRVNAVEAANGFVITGTSNAEAGQAVTVVVLNSVNNQVASYSPTVSGSAWSASVPSGTSSGLAEGTYTVQANVSDAAGNTATQATRTFVVDVTPPTIAIGTVAGDNTLNLAEATAGFVVSGTTSGAETGRTVTVTFVNSTGTTVSAATSTGTVSSSGTWSASLTSTQARGLADGSYTVKANVSDAAGNPATTATQSLTVDETPPTVTAITASPATADLDAGNTVTLTLALSEAVTVSTGGSTPTLSLSSGGTASYVSGSGSNSLVFSYVVAPGQNTPDLTVTGLTLHGGSITDGAGNTLSAASVVQNPAGTLQVDTTAPTLAITAAAGDNRVNAVEAANGFVITGTSNAEAGQTVTVVVLNSNGTQVASYSPAVSGSAWSASVPSGTSSGLAEGTYTVQANVSDAAGNTATQAVGSFVVDVTPPSITISTVAGDNILNLAEATAGFTVSGAAPGAEDGQVVTITIVNGGGTTVDTVTGTVSSNAWSASLTSTQARGLADGSYTVKANVSDAAGNPATTATQSLTVDETPPTVTIGTIAADNILNLAEAQTGISIGGTAPGVENGQVVTVTLVDAGGTTDDTITGTVSGNGWSASLTSAQATALADGLYTARTNVSDIAGNPAPQATQSLTVDETVPTLAIGTIAGDNILNLAEAQNGISISGTAAGVENGQVVTVRLVDVGGTIVDTITGTVSSNAWSTSLSSAQATALADGGDTVTANVADAAGNPAMEATHSLTVDETPPSLTIGTIAGDNTLNLAEATAGFSISGSAPGAENGEVVTVSLLNSGGTIVDTVTGTVSSNTWSTNLTSTQARALADGTYTARANVSDAAGNPATQVARNLTVDQSAPSLTIGTIDGDNILNLADATAGFTLSGTAPGVENGQVVTVRLVDVGGTIVDTITGTVSGNAWSASLGSAQATALADGNDTVTATVADVAGNPAMEATHSLTVDQTPPGLTIGTIAGDDTLNLAEATAGFSIGGTAPGAEDGQVVTVTLVDAGGTTVDTITGTVSGGTWAASVSSAQGTALVDGSATVTANVTDIAGNPATEATRSLTIDETPPSLTIATIAGDNTLNLAEATAGFSISGTAPGAEDGQAVTVTVADATGTTVSTVTVTGIVSSGTWSANLNAGQATSLVDGSDTVTANATDAAGNPAPQAVHSLTVDESVPTLSIGAIAGDNILSLAEASSGFGVSGTATGAENDQVVTVTLVDAVGTIVDTVTGVVANNAWSASLTPVQAMSLVDGLYSVRADVSDIAGNPAATATRALTVDQTAPGLTIGTIAGDDILNLAEARAGLAISGTAPGAENGQVVAVAIVDAGGTAVDTVTGVVANNAWHASLNAPEATALIDGSDTVTANVSDVAGNPAVQAMRSLTVDETPPTLTIGTIAGDNTLNLAEAAEGITINGTASGAENGQVVTVTLADAAGTIVDTLTGTVANAAWSASLGSAQAMSLLDGSDTVTANVSDVAGNPAATATRTLTVDQTAPGLTIGTIAGNDVLNLAKATAGIAISGTASGAETGQVVTVAVVDAGGTTVDTLTGIVSNETWSTSLSSVQATALADGSDTVTANVSDVAGNAATQASRSLTVDETAPGLTIGTIAGDNTLNRAEANAGFTISGTAPGTENGQTVTVALVDAAGTTITTATATVANDAWSASLGSAQATSLVDGNDTVTADVSDVAGNPAAQATHSLAIDETAPTLAIGTIAGDDILNHVEATAGFTINGTASGAENGQVVTVTVADAGGTIVETVTGIVANNAWFTSLGSAQATALADGNDTVTANVADVAGNPAMEATHSLTVDQTPPGLTIGTIAGDDTLNLVEATAGFSIGGTAPGAEDGQVVTVTLVDAGGTTVDTITGTVSGGTWAASVSSAQGTALVDGSATVTANVTDIAGNPATEATRSLTIDETPPSLTIATIAGDNTLNLAEATTGFSISGTAPGAEDGQAVTVTIADATGTTVSTVTGIVSSGTWSANLNAGQATSLVDGSDTVTANVADISGNPAQASRTLRVDQTPPSLTIATIAGDNRLNLGEATAGFTINGTAPGAENGQIVTIALVDAGGATVDTVTGTVANDAWSASVTSAQAMSLADGAYAVTANVADVAGNQAVPVTRTLIVDQTAPAISIGTIAGDDTLDLAEASTGLTISGTATGAEDGQRVTVTLVDASGTTIDIVSGIVSDSAWSASLSPAQSRALGDGPCTVKADVTDLAGNPAVEATRNLAVDETPPTLTIHTIAGDDTLNLAEARAGFTISGTAAGAENGQAVTITVSDPGGTILDTVTGTITDDAWSASVSSAQATALLDGRDTVRASVSDVAGNPAQATRTLTVDQTPPSLIIGTIAGNDILDRAEASAGFTIDGATSGTENGQIVTLAIVDADGSTVDTVTGIVANTVWSASLTAAQATPLVDGAYSVRATVSDLAGNPAAPASRTLIVDQTAPSIAIDTIAGDNILNLAEANAGFTVSGTTAGAENGQIVTVAFVDNTGTTTFTASATVSDSIWSTRLDQAEGRALADGPYHVVANVADAAGNPASTAIRSLTVDETVPAIGIGSIAGDDIVNGQERDAGFVVAGTATGADGSLVSLDIVDGRGTVVGSYTTTVVSKGWSLTIPSNDPGPLADGQYTLTASQTDAAGNTGLASGSFDVDATAPVLTAGLADDTGTSSTDGITAVDILDGTAEANGTVVISRGTTVLGTTAADAQGNWSFSPQGLPDGQTTLLASETDAAGNTGATSLSFTLDTTPPLVAAGLAHDSGTSSSDGLTSDSTLSGTGDPDTVVTLTENGVVLGSTTASATGSWTISPMGLADGAHSILASQTDAAGNLGSATVALVLDTLIPTVTVALSDDTGASSSDRITYDPTLAGTGPANATIVLSEGETRLGSTTTDGTGHWVFTPSGLQDGDHVILATGTDAAGNAGSATLAITLETSPDFTLTEALSHDTGSSATDGVTSDPTLSGTGLADAVVTITENGQDLGTTQTDGNGAWSFASTGLADGLHTLTATETDISGLVEARSASFVLDTKAPAVTLHLQDDTGTSASDGITSNATLTGTADPNATVLLTSDGTSLGSATAGSSGVWAFMPTGLADGLHRIVASDTDAAGNTDSGSASFTLDTTPPVAPSDLVLTPADDSGGDSTTATTPTLTGLSQAGTTITLVDDVGGRTVMLGTTTSDASGNWSFTPTTPLETSLHSLAVTATDAAGNVSVTAAFLLTIDSTYPAVPTALALDPSSDSGAIGDDVTKAVMPTIDGSGPVGDTISLYDGGQSIGTTTVTADGTWSIAAERALADGVHVLTATSTNGAGNSSTASTALDLTVDDTAPAAPTLEEIASQTDPARPEVTGSAEAGSTVSILDGTTLLGTTTATASGSYDYAVASDLAVGSHSLSATATDNAGNISAESRALSLTINNDNSYAVASGSTGTGDTTTRVYDSAGQYTSVDTTDSTGLLLQSVSTTATLRNIYDSAGTLIGTVGEAGSATGAAQPNFTTQRQVLSATTTTDQSGSYVHLLAESHILTLQGNDVVAIDGGEDTISAGSGSVSISGGSGSLLFKAGSGTNTVSGGSGTLTVVGGSGGGLYTGGSAAGNVLSAGGGNTTLLGGSSRDHLNGGTGSSTIVGSSSGSDTIVGGSGTNQITATNNETVFGGTGQSTVFAHSGGNNLIVGTGGNDQMDAEGSSNVMFGGSGADTMFGGDGTATMVGGSGTALMVADSGNTEFVGGPGQSTVWGGTGTDLIWTGTGEMHAVESKNGNDTAILGSGTSTIYGGLGQDVYDIISGEGGGNHTIIGFKVGTDTINPIGYSSSLAQQTVGNSTILTLSDNTIITLSNVTHFNAGGIT